MPREILFFPLASWLLNVVYQMMTCNYLLIIMVVAVTVTAATAAAVTVMLAGLVVLITITGTHNSMQQLTAVDRDDETVIRHIGDFISQGHFDNGHTLFVGLGVLHQHHQTLLEAVHDIFQDLLSALSGQIQQNRIVVFQVVLIDGHDAADVADDLFVNTQGLADGAREAADGTVDETVFSKHSSIFLAYF